MFARKPARKPLSDEGCYYCGEMDKPTEPFVFPKDTIMGCEVFAFRCEECREANPIQDDDREDI